jgi:hypothetical protein
MRMPKQFVLVALLLSCAISASSQDPPSQCSSLAHRAFDFWIGDWNVYKSSGELAGTNSITRELTGCVIHEHYTTPRGYSGESFNIYDASRKVWHQSWVDSDGLLLLLEGNVRDGKMILQGTTVDGNGKRTKHRITWTPNTDGSVRQFWESTDASGKWTIAFDGKYVRK